MIPIEDGDKRRLLFDRSGSSLRIIGNGGRSLILPTCQYYNGTDAFGLIEMQIR